MGVAGVKEAGLLLGMAPHVVLAVADVIGDTIDDEGVGMAFSTLRVALIVIEVAYRASTDL